MRTFPVDPNGFGENRVQAWLAQGSLCWWSGQRWIAITLWLAKGSQQTRSEGHWWSLQYLCIISSWRLKLSVRDSFFYSAGYMGEHWAWGTVWWAEIHPPLSARVFWGQEVEASLVTGTVWSQVCNLIGAGSPGETRQGCQGALPALTRSPPELGSLWSGYKIAAAAPSLFLWPHRDHYQPPVKRTFLPQNVE